MKYLLFLYLLFVYCLPNFAQINLGKLKDLANSELGQKVKSQLKDKLRGMRDEYDEASFNYAVSLSDNAGLYESEERYKKNKRLLVDAIDASAGESSPQDKATSLNSVGEMMYASNKFSSAESSFSQAQKLLQKDGDTSNALYAQIISNKGLLYHTTGRFSLAEKLALKAKSIRNLVAGQNSAVYASSLNNLAVLYKDMGRYSEAEDLINQAVLLNESTLGKQSVAYALSLNNQAMIIYSVGRTQDAEALLEKALEIAGKILKDKSTNYVRLLTNQALMYQDLGKYTEAEAIYLKAIKIKEAKLSTGHPDYAHLLNNLASLYVQMGKNSEVESNLKKAADIYKKKLGDKHPAYASTISNLGNFYRVNNRLVESETYLKQAMNIRKEALGENHPDYVSSIESLGLLFWKQGKITDATPLLLSVTNKSLESVNLYFAPLSEAEKAKLWDKIRPRFQRFYAYAVANSTQDPSLLTNMYNYQLSTKALLLNSSNKIKDQILLGSDNELKEKYLQWLDEKENLAHLYTLSKEELKQENINLDSLERSANALEKNLSSQSTIFSQGYQQKSIVTTTITDAMTSDEAAVEIVQLNKFDNSLTDSIYYASLILTKDKPKQPTLILNKKGNQLNKKQYAYYRNSIRQKEQDEYSYASFWQAINENLQSKKTIYVSLDGVYNQVNLNTLQKPDGKYVIDEKNIVIVTNSKEIVEIKKNTNTTSANTATLIGFPDYGTKGSVAQLPGTQKELANIKTILASKQYKINYLTKSQANEPAIKSIKSPKILHIATHGFFLPEPDTESDEKLFGIASAKAKQNPMLRSGLLLAGAEDAIEGKTENGILTAYEAMNLSLNNTEIVTLSACETGLGDVKNGEGVYGLQRAFLVAGANTIIMSLWKVNDEATQLLMSSFYKNYLLTNNRYKAFRAAQTELKTKYKEPYYWGAFVMVQ